MVFIEPRIPIWLLQLVKNLELKSDLFDQRLTYLDIQIGIRLETEEEEAEWAEVNEQYTAEIEQLRESDAKILPCSAEIRELITAVIDKCQLLETMQKEREERLRKQDRERAAYMERARNAVALLKQANKIYQRTLPPSITPEVPAGLLNQSQKTYQRTLPTWIAPPASLGCSNSIKPFRRTGELYINPKAIQAFGSNYITFDSYHRHTHYEDTAEKPSRGVVWKYDGGGWRGIVISGIPMDSPEPCVNCEHRRKAERNELIQNSKALRARRRDSDSQ